ncbi:MAG TPA: MBL fold metallo-hydrolase [Chloroflexota bacterium]
MFTAPNAGPKTLEGTNAYVVGGRAAYVIDPGPDDERYIGNLAAWLEVAAIDVRGILLTHGHPDHALGAARLSDLLGARVWAAATARYPLYSAPPHQNLDVGSRFSLDADGLRVIPAPGHSADSVVFWLEKDRILFSGDTILGRGTSVVAPPEGDMTAYMQSLARIRELHPRFIAPGHGPVITDGDATIAEYIEHRRRREAQIIAALRTAPATPTELVDRIYVDTPTDLLPLARDSVLAQLEKLEREGSVRLAGGRWQVISDSSLI